MAESKHDGDVVLIKLMCQCIGKFTLATIFVFRMDVPHKLAFIQGLVAKTPNCAAGVDPYREIGECCPVIR